MVSFADKFGAALPGISLSEGVDADFGSTSALFPSGTSTAFFGGILASCLDEFVLGGTCCRGLIQGNYTVLRMGMCIEMVLPGTGCCLVKSHEPKATLPAPKDYDWFLSGNWFLSGVSKGRRLVMVHKGWSMS
jgi:hypothetical protein